MPWLLHSMILTYFVPAKSLLITFCFALFDVYELTIYRCWVHVAYLKLENNHQSWYEMNCLGHGHPHPSFATFKTQIKSWTGAKWDLQPNDVSLSENVSLKKGSSRLIRKKKAVIFPGLTCLSSCQLRRLSVCSHRFVLPWTHRLSEQVKTVGDQLRLCKRRLHILK